MMNYYQLIETSTPVLIWTNTGDGLCYWIVTPTMDFLVGGTVLTVVGPHAAHKQCELTISSIYDLKVDYDYD